MAQDSAQSSWKKSCNRSHRGSSKQKISDEDSQLSHYKKTRYGDLWVSPYDGKSYILRVASTKDQENEFTHCS